uniref:Momilactone A synthase n=1 Tax=Aegilops tauschii subsp. strangulata TaxID=200361 RepID=A0A453AKL2_AEGTS
MTRPGRLWWPRWAAPSAATCTATCRWRPTWSAPSDAAWRSTGSWTSSATTPACWAGRPLQRARASVPGAAASRPWTPTSSTGFYANTLGAALGMKHAAWAMLQHCGGARGGSIVSVASVAGVLGGMGPHAYTASKHTIMGLTKNVACEVGEHGIRVNCVSPFGVATPMLVNAWRHGHHGEDEEGGPAAPVSAEEVEKRRRRWCGAWRRSRARR